MREFAVLLAIDPLGYETYAQNVILTGPRHGTGPRISFDIYAHDGLERYLAAIRSRRNEVIEEIRDLEGGR